ncbi:MAG: Uma2 family endonuclease [Bacteroidia bacterium]|nr:Uma2 family endonuclease [Bacteroidia bacterium]
MADNTLHFEWIALLKGNIELLLADREALVAGDLLWYPVQGRQDICAAPDVLAALGRPKGYRGSYKQWEEGGAAPQVVIEVLSIGNRRHEMLHKLAFYQQYGVQEYLMLDPYAHELTYLVRDPETQVLVPADPGPEGLYESPLLGIRIREQKGQSLTVYYPDGRPFASMADLEARNRDLEAAAARERAEKEAALAEIERLREALRSRGAE